MPKVKIKVVNGSLEWYQGHLRVNPAIVQAGSYSERGIGILAAAQISSLPMRKAYVFCGDEE